MITISAVRKRKQAPISIHQFFRNRALAREGTFAAAGCWLFEDVLLLPTGLQGNKDWLVEYVAPSDSNSC
jgi:hypothetical protein